MENWSTLSENERLEQARVLWKQYERENNELVRNMYRELRNKLREFPLKQDRAEEIEVIIIMHFLGTDEPDDPVYFTEKIHLTP